MRCRPFAKVSLLLVSLASAAAAQELPGVPTSPFSPSLQGPYGEGPGGTPRALVVTRRAERPFLILVPDLRLGVGYSDNLFVTPDVLSSAAKHDGIVSVAPRLRLLFRLSQDFGLILDDTLTLQKFFENGDARQNAGALFLAWRPVEDKHVEGGVRGGTAQVSEFEQNDSREVHGFLSGTYGFGPWASAGLTGSLGIREFPERTRTEAEGFVLGLGPISIPLPIPGAPIVREGEESVIASVAGGLNLRYSATGGLQLAYDFTRNDSEFSDLDFVAHRLTVVGVNRWTDWLSTQLGYSIGFRRFSTPIASIVPPVKRTDTIHDLSAGVVLTPGFLKGLPLLRSTVIRVDYDLLVDQANISNGDFHRNFVSLSLDVGFLPLTSEVIGRLLFPGLYGAPPSISSSSEAAPQ